MADPRVRIRLLGGFKLEGPSGKPASPLSQRRAEGTLAVLAVSADLGCSRDRLVAFFWPESPEPRARHHLRDALYAIRQSLGRETVRSAGDTLRLDPSRVRSDVQDFARALEEGRLADAVALYRGPLLDGFHIGGARAFTEWVEGERTRLFRDRQQAVKELAKRAERRERWDEAARWWGRAVAADRLNSRSVVRRMVALARAGDRANAILEGEEHCRALQTELELDPDPAFLEELDRIRQGEVGPTHFFTPLPDRPAGEDPPPEGSRE